MRPFLNAYPIPNGTDNLATGIAQFNASYSNPARLDASSLRLDHKLSNKWALFARYNYSPSENIQRGSGVSSLSTVSSTRIKTQTITLGTTWTISSEAVNDARFNYSRTSASGRDTLDNFGGAAPLTATILNLPSPFSTANSQFLFVIFPLVKTSLSDGKVANNLQRQINVVDSLAVQKGLHGIKIGADFRRLSPLFDPKTYQQQVFFGSVPSAENGNLLFSIVGSNLTSAFLFRNIGVYAQDTWRIIAHLTLTYGVRWDLDLVPQSTRGPNFPAVTGFNLSNFSNLALAPPGTPPFETTYGNVAPRLGIAYQLHQGQDWQTVVRGGFGVFYDLATSEAGNNIGFGSFPFGSSSFGGGTFPLSAAAAAPPAITPASLGSAFFSAFDPNLKLPYTLQWNVALEQALARQQTISASYVGSLGRRLIQSGESFFPNSNFGFFQFVTNGGTSDYNALQLQLQRRLSHGLQALASYTWAHSIDTGSAGSTTVMSNTFVPSATAEGNRGPSDFDTRQTFSGGLTYDIPAPKTNPFTDAVLRGWSLESIIQSRSATPVDITDANFFRLNGTLADVRPDVVPGKPFYIFGSQCTTVFGSPCPGGKGFNPAAFTNPPTTPAGCVPGVDFPCNPARQGNLGRNAGRGFSAFQWDFAAHRDFPIREALKLQFRAEMFNVLNHPNFGPPRGVFGFGGFGIATQMLGRSLGGNVGGGGLSPLYQIGGPRSIQFALKLQF